MCIRDRKYFHILKLVTDCPGKPHIIKYNYYPKWKAEVPVFPATNGFMSLTPISKVTILQHKDNPIEKLPVLLFFWAFLATFVAHLRFSNSSEPGRL